jgi:hypothetical protein
MCSATQRANGRIAGPVVREQRHPDHFHHARASAAAASSGAVVQHALVQPVEAALPRQLGLEAWPEAFDPLGTVWMEAMESPMG